MSRSKFYDIVSYVRDIEHVLTIEFSVEDRRQAEWIVNRFELGKSWGPALCDRWKNRVKPKLLNASEAAVVIGSC